MPMADDPPLIFEATTIGTLRPVNGAAVTAVRGINGRVKAKLTGMNRNQRRRAFYWVMLDVAAEVLTDKTGDPWDGKLLHDKLKEALNLGETWTTPSGRKVFKPRSTSDKAMNEVERTQWLERCKRALSIWCEVPVDDLMAEAKARWPEE
jgi:hypothetical protein